MHLADLLISLIDSDNQIHTIAKWKLKRKLLAAVICFSGKKRKKIYAIFSTVYKVMSANELLSNFDQICPSCKGFPEVLLKRFCHAIAKKG